ncbi:MAG: UDP-N-acetylmuramoyl-L-alanine--D-glutamate ligase [Bacteroidetes bacterium]|nr:UDP-N-acetylmuramoyl-L-alanine--D-glutamate ligase [Bacteroidota bacterium]
MSKRIVILGSGESGIGSALLAKQKGYDVFVSDAGIIKEHYKKELIDYKIEFEQGGHTEAKILNADEVMKSPGIPEKNEMMKKIRDAGILVISEFELAYRYKGNSKIIGITGTNGKSTTTSLMYHICKTAGLDCALVGNIGYSIARQIAEKPCKYYIAEISSFQLDDIQTFRPDVAVLLNITEDHLDRYDYKFENYIKAKFNITKYQTQDDFFIYNADDEVIQKYYPLLTINTNPLPFSMKQELKKGGHIKGDQMMLRIQEERVSMSIYDFALKGKHNQQNTMAACIAATTVGIRKEKIREAVLDYSGLEHRMEFVAAVRGVDFINDSKATNINSTWFALESMTKPTVLILGGTDKGNDYSLIAELVKDKVKAIVCLGVDNAKIKEAFKKLVPKIVETQSAQKCVEACFKLAAKGDVVLLSPACASFDLFKNYEDRGKQFKQAVLQL